MIFRKLWHLIVIAAAGIWTAGIVPLEAASDRPPITGIANIAFRVSDLEAARNFYGHVLGYEEAFSIPPSGNSQPVIHYKVNDRQYIEISPGLKDRNEDRLIHIGFETKDAEQLRAYLAGAGVKVPEKVAKDSYGNLVFAVKDPDEHAVEFVQYLPDSLQMRNAGKHMPETRLSTHILHVGIHVGDYAAADKFYKEVLGFRLLWEGGPPTNPKAWISYLVPDGSDWVEYMTTANPTPTQLGGMHHVCLEVMDIQKPYEEVLRRGYTPPGKPLVARDGRWLANFFDPDKTRTELMIRKPVQTPCCTELHDPYIR